MYNEKFGTLFKKSVSVEDDLLKIGKNVIDTNDIDNVYLAEPKLLSMGTVYFSVDGELTDNVKEFKKNSFDFNADEVEKVQELLELLDADVLSGPSTSQMEKNDYNKAQEQFKADREESKALKCPKCGSKDLQFAGNKRKGFSVGKAVGGAVLTGGIGTLAGFAGGKGKKNEFVCMNCGKTFTRKK